MRLAASAVLAVLVSLILFYAMQSMIAGVGRPPEKPAASRGIGLVPIGQVNLTTATTPGRRPIPPPPAPTDPSPAPPSVTFESAIQPGLPYPMSAVPELPAVKPGGKPYLGAYLDPSKEKPPQSPSSEMPVASRPIPRTPPPGNEVARDPKASEPQRFSQPKPQQLTSSPDWSAPHPSPGSTNAPSRRAATGDSGRVNLGALGDPANGSGLLADSTGNDDGMLVEEVIALFKTTPVYPRKAARSGEEGWVKIEFTITAQGEVANPKVIDSKPRRIFDRAALRAIRKWRFKPKMVDGKPVARRAVQVIEFKLAAG